MNFKEVVDNALDTDADAVLDQIGPDTWLVTDDGPGLDRRQVVRLFAVNRSMTSTKLVRRPTRGAIGNGLRVVTAASWRVVVGSSSKAAVPATSSRGGPGSARRGEWRLPSPPR
jgi:hypothetical protein